MKENLYNFVWIFVLYGYLIGAQFLPKEFQPVVVPFGIVIIFSMLFLQELFAMKVIAKYIHLYAIIRTAGGSIKKDLFVRDYNSIRISGDKYRTELVLGMKENIGKFKKVSRLYLFHRLPIEARWLLASGSAYYAGMMVDHPQSDVIILWEEPEPRWEEGDIVPQYRLVEAGMDRNRVLAQYRLEEDLLNPPELKTGVIKDGE